MTQSSKDKKQKKSPALLIGIGLGLLFLLLLLIFIWPGKNQKEPGLFLAFNSKEVKKNDTIKDKPKDIVKSDKPHDEIKPEEEQKPDAAKPKPEPEEPEPEISKEPENPKPDRLAEIPKRKVFKTGTLFGKLEDENGWPIKEGFVNSFYPEGKKLDDDDTDKNGAFSIKVFTNHPNILLLSAPGFADALITDIEAQSGDPAVFVMKPEYFLKGKVFEAGSRTPISNFSIEMPRNLYNTRSEFLFTKHLYSASFEKDAGWTARRMDVQDERGEFEIRGLDKDSFCGLIVSAPGYKTRFASSFLNNESNSLFPIPMEKAENTFGGVVRDELDPKILLSGALVEYFIQTAGAERLVESVWTDQEGKFQLCAPLDQSPKPGEPEGDYYKLRVSMPGQKKLRYGDKIFSLSSLLPDFENQLFLSEGCELEVKLRDRLGNRIPNALLRVSQTQSGPTLFTGRTDNRGVYKFPPLNPGPYILQSYYDVDGLTHFEQLSVELPKRKEFLYEFNAFNKAAYKGKFLLAGRPPRGTLIRLGNDFTSSLGPDGYFQIRDLPEGKYDLVVETPALSISFLDKREFDKGLIIYEFFRLPTDLLEATMLLDDKSKAQGAEIQIQGKPSNPGNMIPSLNYAVSANVQSNPQGLFRAEVPRYQTYEIKARKDNYFAGLSDVKPPLRPFELIMKKSADFEIQVIDLNTLKALENFNASFFREDFGEMKFEGRNGICKAAIPFPDGNDRFNMLSIHYQISAEGYEVWTSDKVLDSRKIDGKLDKVKLKLSGAMLGGRVLDKQTGLPLAATIKLETMKGDKPFAEIKLDKDGSFKIVGIPEGSYRFSIDMEGYAGSSWVLSLTKYKQRLDEVYELRKYRQ